jgi:hypothetical protein
VINPAVSPPRWKSCGAIVDGSSEMRNAAIMSVPACRAIESVALFRATASGAVAVDLRGVERLLGGLRGALHGFLHLLDAGLEEIVLDRERHRDERDEDGESRRTDRDDERAKRSDRVQAYATGEASCASRASRSASARSPSAAS